MTKARLLLFITAVSVAFSCPARAQESQKARKKNVRTQITAARNNIKNGTNLDDAEASMRALLLDSANIENDRIWLTLFDAVKKRQDGLNEKLYLKQESDTAAFFTNTLHLFSVLESMDSVDAATVTGNSSRPKYRDKHAAYLLPLRRNLYGGGGYFLKKQDYASAYPYFDAYLGCAVQPLFSGYTFTGKEMTDAAYWAAYCGYKLRRPEIIDKYAGEAMADSAHEMYVLQYSAEASIMRGDTASYHATLLKGFGKYPESPYFFKYLAMYYSRHNRYGDVLSVAGRLLSIDGENVPALIARSSALLHLRRYGECAAASDSVIALDASQPLPYFYAGLSWYNRIRDLEARKTRTKDDREEIGTMYRKALPYFEKFRSLEPEAVGRWGTPLYDIYYNLNMGPEFEEMEKLLGR